MFAKPQQHHWFSTFSVCLCSAVLLYWHLVGSAQEMGEQSGQDSWKYIQPTKYSDILFILDIQKPL